MLSSGSPIAISVDTQRSRLPVAAGMQEIPALWPEAGITSAHSEPLLAL